MLSSEFKINEHFDLAVAIESNIYRDTKIRPTIYELFENEKRVLVIKVPSRPAGKVFKFEDVALMRVGEELKPMSDAVYLKIINEQEPDFSQQFCQNLKTSDLDERAITILKEKYALKQNQRLFAQFSGAAFRSQNSCFYNFFQIIFFESFQCRFRCTAFGSYIINQFL